MAIRLKMDMSSAEEEFLEGCHLIGIIAPVKSYQFIWFINQYMGYGFRMNNDLEMTFRKKTREYKFSVYEFPEPNCCLRHYLYQNQHDGEYLLPEFKHLDFLWLTRGEDVPEEELKLLLQSLKLLPNVQLVTELAHDKIRNKENLMF